MFACEQVTDSLAEQGVDVRTGQKATASRRDGGEITVTLDDGSDASADELLVAVGRTPQSEGLGLEASALEAGGYVEVDGTAASPATTGCT